MSETDKEIAARVIAATRAEHESPAACDYRVAVRGIGDGPFASIDEVGGQVYWIANEGFDGGADEAAARARALWERILPELQKYEQECQARQYVGWSNASKGLGRSIQYADDEVSP